MSRIKPTATDDSNEVKSTVLQASLVLKDGRGFISQLDVFNSKGSAQFILLIDSPTLPADGPVTLLYPPIPIAANTLLQLNFVKAIEAKAGIVVCNSSTGTFSKTIGSADCVFYARIHQPV